MSLVLGKYKFLKEIFDHIFSPSPIFDADSEYVFRISLAPTEAKVNVFEIN